MKSYFLVVFFFYGLCFSQKKNYIDYHKDINKAEELFFMKNKTDSALFYYDKVFANYEFIFVKDLVNAAQIAIFSKKSYKKYIEQGFEQGLKMSHLRNYPLFSKVYIDLLRDRKLITAYSINRKKYIARIDFKYLDWIYKIAIKDQKNKSVKGKYTALVFQTTERLKDSIIKKGFPGDKLIGIADSTIFKEIKKPYLDLYEQRKSDPKLWYMTSDENILSPNWPQIMLVHNTCSFALYKDILMDQMGKGNIHPRDIALIYDNMHRFKGEFASYCENVSFKGAYLLNMFTDYSFLTNGNL